MFDIIITTCNRPDPLEHLINSLISLKNTLLNQIIIIDSSDSSSFKKISHKKVSHYTSQHKNQPYQRFLGWNLSNSKFQIFLDDDIKIINRHFIDDCYDQFKDNRVVGVNFKIEQKSNNIEEINIKMRIKAISPLINLLIGSPTVSPNKFIFCGKKGKRIDDKNIEFLSGGAFAIKRNCAYKNFNMQLFDIYEKNLGKSEDAIFGYNLSKIGDIKALSNTYFIHEAEHSYYNDDLFGFFKRIMYSRLFLSCEYYRLRGKSIILGYFRYYHYAIFQLGYYFIRYIKKPSNFNKNHIKGYLFGFITTFTFRYKNKTKINEYWTNQVGQEKEMNLE